MIWRCRASSWASEGTSSDHESLLAKGVIEKSVWGAGSACRQSEGKFMEQKSKLKTSWCDTRRLRVEGQHGEKNAENSKRVPGSLETVE